jgi:hypothetical protein
MTSATEADLKTLAEEVATLRADLASITTTLQDLVRHGTDDASHLARDSFARVRSELHDARERVTRKIEEEPVTAALTAFGIGMLLGMSCRR